MRMHSRILAAVGPPDELPPPASTSGHSSPAGPPPPDKRYVRKFRWQQAVLIALVPAAIVALVLGAIATVVNSEQHNEIVQVQHSACQVKPAGKECQVTKQESSRAASTYTTCIQFLKVGYPCPRPGSGIHIRPGETSLTPEPPPAPSNSSGTPPSTGSEPGQGPQHGHSTGPSSGGHVSPAAPNEEPADLPPNEEPSSAPETGSGNAPREVAEEHHPIRGAGEAVGTAVQGAGDAVSTITCAATSQLHPCPNH